jgi:hypothetical protein
MYIKLYHGLKYAKDFGGKEIIICNTDVETTSGGKDIRKKRKLRKYITTTK